MADARRCKLASGKNWERNAMSRWTDQFQSHGVHADYVRLQQLLAEVSVTDLLDTEELARLRKVTEFVANLLNAMDPEICGIQVLNNIHGHVQNAANEVAAYNSNQNVGHLQNANSHFDSVVAQVSQTPFTAYGSAKASLTRAATVYSETMYSYAEKFQESLQGLREDAIRNYQALETLHTAATTTQNKLDTRISGMESQLPTLLSGFNTDFQSSEKDRIGKFDSWSTLYQEKLDGQFAEAAKKFSTGEDAMGEYLDRAGKLLGVVVDTSQAGAYATYANDEKKSANLYRRSAIVLMGLAALIWFLPELAAAIKAGGDHSIDWRAALQRVPFSLILFAPALYLAKESSRHRTNEVVNRRRQHILSTIGPYLALLDAKKAEEIRVDVAKSIFKDNMPLGEDKSPDTASVLAQVSSLVDIVLRKKS
jgi:hypothetical protein